MRRSQIVVAVLLTLLLFSAEARAATQAEAAAAMQDAQDVKDLALNGRDYALCHKSYAQSISAEAWPRYAMNDPPGDAYAAGRLSNGDSWIGLGDNMVSVGDSYKQMGDGDYAGAVSYYNGQQWDLCVTEANSAKGMYNSAYGAYYEGSTNAFDLYNEAVNAYWDAQCRMDDLGWPYP